MEMDLVYVYCYLLQWGGTYFFWLYVRLKIIY